MRIYADGIFGKHRFLKNATLVAMHPALSPAAYRKPGKMLKEL
jgi:hypothetical protein